MTADLGRGWEGEHELTAADVRAHADAKARADAERGSDRKAPRRWLRVPAEAQQKSPGRYRGDPGGLEAVPMDGNGLRNLRVRSGNR